MQADVIDITVNGEPKAMVSNLTITGLLSALEIPADRVAVELNKAIVRKRDWDKTSVSNGSQVEIVQFVGGG